MDKKTFFNTFKVEDRMLLSNLFEKLTLCARTGVTVFTNDFYIPSVWKTLKSMEKDFGVKVSSFGVFEESERRMISFSQEDDSDYPLQVFKIENKSKFSTLRHKDYLGAVMALGIKREKLGDFVLGEGSCYFPASLDISTYLLDNISFIGNSPCKTVLVQDLNNLSVQLNSSESTIIVTSLRADSVIASLCNVSRSTSVELIEQGKVLLDYNVINSKEKKICIDNIITVRGYGKFKIFEELGFTQKGRVKLLIKKYI